MISSFSRFEIASIESRSRQQNLFIYSSKTRYPSTIMAIMGAQSLVTGSNNGGATVVSSTNSSSNHATTVPANSSSDCDSTTVLPNNNNNNSSNNDNITKSSSSLQVEEAVVVDSTSGPNGPSSLMMSTVSLSSASPASVDLQQPHAAVSGLAPPVNSPTKGTPVASSSPNFAHFNADFLSCFAPLGRFWPHNLFNWASQKGIHSDSDTENYEIPIDSIDVQWEENFIGGGNQSSVFRGKFRGQWIALKKLNRTSEVDIKRLCSLEHANVIKTLGICTKEHFPCIVMEYCEQGSLFEYLRRNPHISKYPSTIMAIMGAQSLVTGSNNGGATVVSSTNSSSNHATTVPANSSSDCDSTTVLPNNNNNNNCSNNDNITKSSSSLQVEEAVVVDSTSGPNGPSSLMMSTVSLSSASPASVDLQQPHAAVSGLAPPVNSPAKGTPVASSSPNFAHFNADFLSCFAPLGRFWPHNLFNWASQKGIHSDSDTENYEIPIDSIDVQWEENFIGGGNQSSVFRGKFRGQWIALKKLNRTSEVDIKRLCSLEHANVIKTLGICTKEHFPCIVMEYCEQGSLFEYLRRNPHISKSMFINCCSQIAEGMCYLHSLKIVHRDLKSPNILIDNNNTVKICDFGSLYSWDQRLNSHTHNPQGMASVVMSVCGTSQWMSPEMLTNKPCNERVDVWSYGVVVWELLTGEVPYDKLPPTAVWFLVGSGNLQLHVPKTAPGSLSFLLTLCWAKNPRNRPSFKTILKDLLSNVKAELCELQEEGWGYRRVQWKRDNAEKMAKLHNSGMDFIGEQQREQQQQQMGSLGASSTFGIGHQRHSLRQIRAPPTGGAVSATAATSVGRPAMLRMTYYDYGPSGRRHTGIAQKVVQRQQPPPAVVADSRTAAAAVDQRRKLNVAGKVRKLQRVPISSPIVAGSAASSSSSSSTAGCSTDDDEEQAVPASTAAAAARPAPHKFMSGDYQTKTTGKRSSAAQQQQQQQQQNVVRGRSKEGSQMSSCPSDCSLVAKTSSIILSNSSSRYSADFEAPTKPMSRDDSAISSTTVPFSQSDRSLQSLSLATTNNNCPSSTNAMAPSDCSLVAKTSSIILSNSSSRYSADFEAPTKPMSRDDSAISSTTVPFSQSDRSLQGLSLATTNNNCPSSTNAMACLNCHYGIQPQQINHFFARNSVARASGLSADSGVCQEEECLESNGNWLLHPGGTKTCCLAPNTCQCMTSNRNSSSPSSNRTTSNINTNNNNRWTTADGDVRPNQREAARFRRRRPSAHSTFQSQPAMFARNSSLRKPSTRCADSRTARSRLEQQGALDHDLERLESVAGQMFITTSSSSSATLVGKNEPILEHRDLVRLRRESNDNNRSGQQQQQQLVLSSFGHHPQHWFSTPELYQQQQQQQQSQNVDGGPETGDEHNMGQTMAIVDDENMAMDFADEGEEEEEEEEEEDSELKLKQRDNNNIGVGLSFKLCPINEMSDSQVTEKAMAAEKAMATAMLESLSSTMVER
uniref:Protein kinase domain-containing protein n=1 Tax=Globodera pallida TaxID=36090 RepID=A0A183BSD3_GLOPA